LLLPHVKIGKGKDLLRGLDRHVRGLKGLSVGRNCRSRAS
jgi:hypothetical protein